MKTKHQDIFCQKSKISPFPSMNVFLSRTSLEDSSHSTPSPLSSAASSQVRNQNREMLQLPQLNLIASRAPFTLANCLIQINSIKATAFKLKNIFYILKNISGLPSHGPVAGTGASGCGSGCGKEERAQVFSWKVGFLGRGQL